MKEQEIKEKERELGIKLNKTEKEFLLSDNEKWIFTIGVGQKLTISNIVRQIKFKELKEEEWIYKAGMEWQGITDEMRAKRWDELKEEEWIYWSGLYWHGITDEMRIKRWYELKSEKQIYQSGKYWSGITGEMQWERFKELKSLGYIFRALEDWQKMGIDKEDLFQKTLTSEIKADDYYLSTLSLSSSLKIKIYDSFQKTKNQVIEKLLNGEINHESFIRNYPFIREKILLKCGLKEKDLSNFDYFYQNLSMSYGLLK